MKLNDITYAINGAVFEVNDILGPGFLEKVYENALLFELKKRGLKVKNQVPIKVSYKGEVVGDYTADLLIEDKDHQSRYEPLKLVRGQKVQLPPPHLLP